MKKFKKNQYPKSSRGFVDSDYKENVPVDADGKPIESLRLSESEKEFMYKFEDEYYANNHRDGELFKGLDDYNKIKKELDDQTNARNRDIYNKNYNVSIRDDDLTKIIAPEYDNSIKEQMKKEGFEKTINNLFTETAHDIIMLKEGTIDISSLESVLRNLTIQVVKGISLEKAFRKKQRRKK